MCSRSTIFDILFGRAIIGADLTNTESTRIEDGGQLQRKSAILGVATIAISIAIGSYMISTNGNANDVVGHPKIVSFDTEHGTVIGDSIETESVEISGEGGIEFQSSQTETSSISTPLFTEPPIELYGALESWRDNTFLASHEAPDIIVRTNFVSVDVARLKNQLLESLSDVSHGAATYTAAVDLTVFPDRSYEVVAYRYRMGSGGFSNIGARVVDGTGMANQTFGFEIAPDGRIFGRGNTSTGSYSFEPTPEDGVLLVVEIDGELVGKRVRFD